MSIGSMNFGARIQQFKSQCNRVLNLIWSVSSTGWGADRKTLVMIYKELIWSKLNYECIVYSSANGTDLSGLETVAKDAMRIASRCIKSTLTTSIQVINEQPLLQIRRNKLSLKYCYKAKSLTKPCLQIFHPRTRNYVQLDILPSLFNQNTKNTNWTKFKVKTYHDWFLIFSIQDQGTYLGHWTNELSWTDLPKDTTWPQIF